MRIVLVAFILLLGVFSHPQCDTGNSPSQSYLNELTFCKDYTGDFGACCGEADDTAIRNQVMSLGLSTACRAYHDQVACLTCHSWEVHVLVDRNPVLCTDFCNAYYSACRNELNMPSTYCADYSTSAEESLYCYPIDHSAQYDVAPEGFVEAFPNLQLGDSLVELHPLPNQNKYWAVISYGRPQIVEFDDFTTVSQIRPILTLSTATYNGFTSVNVRVLGMALAPDFSTTGAFYVHYRISDRIGAQVSRFFKRPNPIDTRNSEQVILRFPSSIGHAAGGLYFRSDKLLYFPTGDSEIDNDPLDTAQNLKSLLGKVLRVDVSDYSKGGYKIVSHSLVSRGALPEIYAYGLRHPYSCKVDRVTDELWCCDVGQEHIEECNVIVEGGNYGWRDLEGSRPNTNQGLVPDLKRVEGAISPFFEYCHVGSFFAQNCPDGTVFGNAAMAGYIYRGTRMPQFQGKYIFGDYTQGSVMALTNANNQWTGLYIARHSFISLVGFTEMKDGELLIIEYGPPAPNGKIWRFDYAYWADGRLSPPGLNYIDPTFLRFVMTPRIIPGTGSFDIVFAFEVKETSVLFVDLLNQNGGSWHGKAHSYITGSSNCFVLSVNIQNAIPYGAVIELSAMITTTRAWEDNVGTAYQSAIARPPGVEVSVQNLLVYPVSNPFNCTTGNRIPSANSVSFAVTPRRIGTDGSKRSFQVAVSVGAVVPVAVVLDFFGGSWNFNDRDTVTLNPGSYCVVMRIDMVLPFPFTTSKLKAALVPVERWESDPSNSWQNELEAVFLDIPTSAKFAYTTEEPLSSRSCGSSTTATSVEVKRYPSEIKANSLESFDVLVSAEVTGSAVLIVDILDNSYNWYGSGRTFDLTDGEQCVVISVTLSRRIPSSTAIRVKASIIDLEVYNANPSDAWKNVLVEQFVTTTSSASTRYTSSLPLTVSMCSSTFVATNSLRIIEKPRTLKSDSTTSFQVSTSVSAVEPSQLVLDVFDSAFNWFGRSAISVGSGESCAVVVVALQKGISQTLRTAKVKAALVSSRVWQDDPSNSWKYELDSQFVDISIGADTTYDSPLPLDCVESSGPSVRVRVVPSTIRNVAGSSFQVAVEVIATETVAVVVDLMDTSNVWFGKGDVVGVAAGSSCQIITARLAKNFSGSVMKVKASLIPSAVYSAAPSQGWKAQIVADVVETAAGSRFAYRVAEPLSATSCQL